MPSHTINPVNLIYSKPVKKGKTNKPEESWVLKKTPKVVRGEILQKTIQAYRMWFLFLKLGLELEQQGTILVMKESSFVVTDDGTKTQTGTHTKSKQITKQVIVNKKKYEGWDLEQVLENKFDDWWFGRNGCNEHRYLFVDEVCNVLSVGDAISSNPNHITIQFDRRSRLVDVQDDLRQMNEKQKLFNNTEREEFNIKGRVRPDTLLNRYNCLVLKLLDEMSNEEIITHRHEYIRQTDNRNNKGYSGKHFGRTIFELISGNAKSFGAKQILMSVCDGYFVKHHTKTYME